MEQKIEIWKDIPHLKGYQISSFGRCKSIDRVTIYLDGRKCNFKSRILKPCVKPDKYIRYIISQQGKCKLYSAHRLVALCFLENLENKKIVNHLDSNPSNNNVSNLEWCTDDKIQFTAYRECS